MEHNVPPFYAVWPVAPFAFAHTFCASQDFPRNSDFLKTAPTEFKSISVQLMTTCEKMILARAIEIPKKT